MPARAASAIALTLLGGGAAAASPALMPVPPAVRRALHAASVRIEPVGCSGVLAVGPDIVLTARHCVDRQAQDLEVRFTTGSTRIAAVAATDEGADQAVLLLDAPVPIDPLPLVRRRQIPGTVLYFEGNPGQPRWQRVRLDRVGRCEALPRLRDALFTSLRGAPGDSGAPLVDAAGEIVGLVHGGERCHIVTPAASLARLVARVRDRPPRLLGHEPERQRMGKEADHDVAPVLARHRLRHRLDPVRGGLGLHAIELLAGDPDADPGRRRVRLDPFRGP